MDPKSVKTQKNKMKGLVFILRGKNRKQIYHLLLNKNLTQSQISKMTAIPITNVYRVIKQLEKIEIVKNHTPEERIGCIYGLTSFGKSFKTEFLEHLSFLTNKER
jgi:sugar-specific transcriptional regulator TrmB